MNSVDENITPDFSVIIAVYNTPELVRECLDSIIEAAKKATSRIEIICVDDGSTDETASVVDEYAKIGCQDRLSLQVFHKPNGGHGSALNYGLDRALGRWICLVDGDDMVLSSYFMELERCLCVADDVDFIRFEVCPFNDASDVVLGKDSGDGGGACRHDISHGFEKMDAPGYLFSAAYSKAILMNIRIRPYLMCDDLLFVTEVLLASRCYVSCSRQIYGYRQRAGSICHQPERFERVADRIHAWRDILVGCENSHGRSGKRYVRHYCNHLTELAVHGILLRLPEGLHGQEHELWKIWDDAIREVGRLRIISTFQRLRIKLYLLIRCKLAARLLFSLPFAVKLMIGKLRK